jgi:hypothetical protein
LLFWCSTLFFSFIIDSCHRGIVPSKTSTWVHTNVVSTQVQVISTQSTNTWKRDLTCS